MSSTVLPSQIRWLWVKPYGRLGVSRGALGTTNFVTLGHTVWAQVGSQQFGDAGGLPTLERGRRWPLETISAPTC